jgi:hypothetical protein
MAILGVNSKLQDLLDEKLHGNFTEAIDLLVEKCAAPAAAIRPAISELYTKTDLSIYWNPVLEKVGIYARPVLDPEEYNWGISTLREKFGADLVQSTPLTGSELTAWWVKVAYSPTLRRVAEFLQFFPSKDIPGFGGRPIASTVASGLLGAGLGYGSGYIGEKLLPSWAQGDPGSLRRRWMLFGGLGGATAGAIPGMINLHEGRKFNDPTLWKGFPEEGFNRLTAKEKYVKAVDNFVEKQADLASLGGPSFSEAPLIRMNELGNVLWGTNANPQTTAMTMGAVYGASQFPDPRARPGAVTTHQMGLLGTAMGAAGGGINGYITGRAVGHGLGLLTGMPQSTQKLLGQTGAAAGVLNTIIPKLYY